MAKIAIYLPSLAGGGAERVGLFVTNLLSEAGFDVDLVVARRTGVLADDPIAKRHCVDLRAPNEMLSLPHLVRYYDEVRPDLLFALIHSAKIMAGLAKKIRPSLPLAISLHNTLDLPRWQRFWPRAIFGHALERWLYRDVIAVHCVSHAIAKEVERYWGIPREKISTIYNPMNRFGNAGLLPPEHLSIFDRPVLVNAGRLVAQKRQEMLIDAFGQSGLAGRAQLLILGEGERRAALERRISALGLNNAVTLLGHVPDILPYLAQAAGFVLSSRNEGLPLVLIEALGAGCPVAAMDCPTGPREILKSGKLGYLVPNGNIEQLAIAMRNLVDGRAISVQGQVEEHFDAFRTETVRNQYVKFVEDSIGRTL